MTGTIRPKSLARSDRNSQPSNLYLEEMHNFDEKSLLVFHEHWNGPFKEMQPYMFISKEDGSILSRLNITMSQANPRVLGNIILMNNSTGNCKFGQEYILANMSSDTIYMLKQDKTLIPLFVQKPSVFSDSPLITSVGLKTDDIIQFSVYPYDLKGFKRRRDSGIKEQTETRFLMYEFETGQLFECDYRKNKFDYWVEKADVPKNTSFRILNAYLLKERLEKGRLEGKLKEVAEKLKFDDNPVIEITRYISH